MIRRPAQNERGGIIIVALLVLLAMAGLALVGVRSTFHEVRSSGNHNLARMSYNIAEAGANATLAIASSNPMGFMNIAAGSAQKVTIGQLGVQELVWDLDPGGSLGFASAALGTPNVWTELDPPVPLEFYPGSSAGEFCAQKLTWRTHAILGDSVANDPLSALDRPMHGEKVILSRWIMGPLDCAGGN